MGRPAKTSGSVPPRPSCAPTRSSDGPAASARPPYDWALIVLDPDVCVTFAAEHGIADASPTWDRLRSPPAGSTSAGGFGLAAGGDLGLEYVCQVQEEPRSGGEHGRTHDAVH